MLGCEDHIKQTEHGRALNRGYRLDWLHLARAANLLHSKHFWITRNRKSHSWHLDAFMWMLMAMGNVPFLVTGPCTALRLLFIYFFLGIAAWCVYTQIHTHLLLCVCSLNRVLWESVSGYCLSVPLCVPKCLPLQNNGLRWENLNMEGLSVLSVCVSMHFFHFSIVIW